MKSMWQNGKIDKRNAFAKEKMRRFSLVSPSREHLFLRKEQIFCAKLMD